MSRRFQLLRFPHRPLGIGCLLSLLLLSLPSESGGFPRRKMAGVAYAQGYRSMGAGFAWRKRTKSFSSRQPAQRARFQRNRKPAPPTDISFDVVLLPKAENDFRSLTEWLTGRRDSEGRWALRSDGDRRRGLYWVLRFSKPLSAQEPCSSAVLKYIRRGSLEVQERCFDFGSSRPRRAGELYLGVTDDASLQQPDDVAAWCVQLRDASGTPIGEKRSFLWGDETDAIPMRWVCSGRHGPSAPSAGAEGADRGVPPERRHLRSKGGHGGRRPRVRRVGSEQDLSNGGLNESPGENEPILSENLSENRTI